MEALSPSSIENLLSDRLKRHEERLREHRSALAGQKLWLERNKSGGGGGAGAATSDHQQLRPEIGDERYTNAFHPSQVLPSSSSAPSSSASPSQMANNNNSSSAQPQPSSVPSPATVDHQPTPLDAGSLASRQHHPPPQQQQQRPQEQQQQQQRPAARTTSPRTGSSKPQQRSARGGSAGSRSQSASGRNPSVSQQSNDHQHHHHNQFHQQHRTQVLAAAMADRGERASKMMLKFGPETGEAVGVDILSGDSIMDVAATESAACTFKPAISADSRVLAKKLRAACGAQGKDVVSAMDAIHARAKEQKWLRMQQIHEEQTRPFHNPASARGGGGNQRTPARGGQQVSTTTPRGGLQLGATSPRASGSVNRHQQQQQHGTHQQHHSVASSSGSAAHARLHQQATKHVKEERFRQIVANATQENTFSPAITHRARALRRHPGHSVGDDLYGLSLMKSNREALAAQLRDEMEHATAQQQGQPTIDSVSASIATSLAESSYERLTKPHHRGRAASAGPSSRGSSASSSSRHSGGGGGGLEPTFAPEINRRSEILAHTSSMQHSPNTVRQRREEKLRQLRDEVEQQRMEECTFQPSINDHHLRQQMESQQQQQQQQRGGGSFFSRNEAWMKRRDKNIAEMRAEKKRHELDECVFQPAQTTLGHGFAGPSSSDSGGPVIYGGADRRAWGVDHHMDRMEAARIIDKDRRDRAASGMPYSEHHQEQQQQQQQHDHHNRDHLYQQVQQMQQQQQQQSYYRDPTDMQSRELRVFGGDNSRGQSAGGGGGGGEHQVSVLSRAQEALARAVAVSADQQY